VRLVFNFTEKREAVNITNNYGGTGAVLVANNTLGTKAAADFIPGDMQMRNTTIVGEEWKKEFEFVVNGKGVAADKMLRVRPLECILGTCTIAAIDTSVPLETTVRKWSVASSWTSGKVPVAGEHVVINATQNFELDIAETPMLGSLEINGRLSFKDDVSLPIVKLRAMKIFVRAGTLRIGAWNQTYSHTALIELGGGTASETLTLGGTIKAGNKVIASSGKIEFFGAQRTTMSRLLKTAVKGETQIQVDKTVDWKVGDQIYIAPSTVQMDYSEYRKIAAITDGLITLSSPLAYYHYGKTDSTASMYNGIDIRTEVFLLTRNIQVYGDPTDGWPMHMLATDLIEQDGTIREGSIIMDNVEVFNCSQKDKGNACLRFEGAVGSSKTWSSISRSTFHHGQDWGLSIYKSENIKLEKNVFVGWRAIGARLDLTKNTTVVGNFVGDVNGRNIAFLGMTIDKETCWAVGSYDNTKTGSKNTNLVFTDNIAAGCPFSGFIAPGYLACGEVNSKIFYNNVAHSVGGYGAYVYANPLSTTTSKCMEFSHFAAYKTVEACLVSFVPTQEQKAHHITCVDVQKGLSLNTGVGERESVKIILEDSQFFGEAESEDCPNPEACVCENKFTLMNAQNMND